MIVAERGRLRRRKRRRHSEIHARDSADGLPYSSTCRGRDARCSADACSDAERCGSTATDCAAGCVSLPPEKLAKAIALNRIRNILHIVDAFWGLAVLWLLLATGAAARLEAWAKSVAETLVAGAAVFCCADCCSDGGEIPLDMYWPHLSWSTASACRAGRAGLAIRASHWRWR